MFSFVLTDSAGGRSYGYCLAFYHTPHAGATHATSRVLCLLSQWAYPSVFFTFLRMVRGIITRPGPSGSADASTSTAAPALPFTSVERALVTFYRAAFVPPPGVTLTVACGAHRVWFSRPSFAALPPADAGHFRQLFSCLSPATVVSLVSCLLMEQRLLVHSEDVNRLAAVCESLAALLFPFVWSHVYVPLLPLQLIEYASAPMPFVMGMPTAMLGTREGLECVVNSVVVHVDLDKLVTPMDMELPGGAAADTLPEFPVDLKNRLEGHLQAVVPPRHVLAGQPGPDASSAGAGAGVDAAAAAAATAAAAAAAAAAEASLPSNGATSVATTEQWVTYVRAAFLECTSALLEGYRTYLTVSHVPNPIGSPEAFETAERLVVTVTDVALPGVGANAGAGAASARGALRIEFDRQGFIKAAPPHYRPFLVPLLRTQAFMSFCEDAGVVGELLRLQAVAARADPALPVDPTAVTLGHSVSDSGDESGLLRGSQLSGFGWGGGDGPLNVVTAAVVRDMITNCQLPERVAKLAGDVFELRLFDWCVMRHAANGSRQHAIDNAPGLWNRLRSVSRSRSFKRSDSHRLVSVDHHDVPVPFGAPAEPSDAVNTVTSPTASVQSAAASPSTASPEVGTAADAAAEDSGGGGGVGGNSNTPSALSSPTASTVRLSAVCADIVRLLTTGVCSESSRDVFLDVAAVGDLLGDAPVPTVSVKGCHMSVPDSACVDAFDAAFRRLPLDALPTVHTDDGTDRDSDAIEAFTDDDSVGGSIDSAVFAPPHGRSRSGTASLAEDVASASLHSQRQRRARSRMSIFVANMEHGGGELVMLTPVREGIARNGGADDGVGSTGRSDGEGGDSASDPAGAAQAGAGDPVARRLSSGSSPRQGPLSGPQSPPPMAGLHPALLRGACTPPAGTVSTGERTNLKPRRASMALSRRSLFAMHKAPDDADTRSKASHLGSLLGRDAPPRRGSRAVPYLPSLLEDADAGAASAPMSSLLSVTPAALPNVLQVGGGSQSSDSVPQPDASDAAVARVRVDAEAGASAGVGAGVGAGAGASIGTGAVATPTASHGAPTSPSAPVGKGLHRVHSRTVTVQPWTPRSMGSVQPLMSPLGRSVPTVVVPPPAKSLTTPVTAPVVEKWKAVEGKRAFLSNCGAGRHLTRNSNGSASLGDDYDARLDVWELLVGPHKLLSPSVTSNAVQVRHCATSATLTSSLGMATTSTDAVEHISSRWLPRPVHGQDANVFRLQHAATAE